MRLIERRNEWLAAEGGEQNSLCYRVARQWQRLPVVKGTFSPSKLAMNSIRLPAAESSPAS